MSGFYLWKSPSGATVQLKLDVVERMLMDVMRGFGAVPKRGAEVGGILLGSIDPVADIITVDDYVQVAIEYRRGPSYLLAAADIAVFDAALEKAQGKVVGFFRSNTRDSIGFTAEDADFCEARFPDRRMIGLFIRPYATKVSTASIIEKRGDRFLQGPPRSEFPFRRREMEGGDEEREERPRRRDRSRREAGAIEALPPGASGSWQTNITAITPEFALPNRSPAGWLASPAWVIGLLALGSVFGLLTSRLLDGTSFDIPLLRSSRPPDPAAFQFHLTATASGDDIILHWSREAPLFTFAHRARITIDDGGTRKIIDLNRELLQSGGLVYRRAAPAVTFRMEVFTSGAASLLETVEWK